MINPIVVREGLIAALKANAPLVAVVGDEIREVQYQSHDFKYPAVRVRVTLSAPFLMSDDCRDSALTYTFDAFCYSEDASSYQCENLMYLVQTALSGKSLSLASGKAGVMHTLRDIHPIRETQRVWRGQVTFQSNVYTG